MRVQLVKIASPDPEDPGWNRNDFYNYLFWQRTIIYIHTVIRVIFPATMFSFFLTSAFKGSK